MMCAPLSGWCRLNQMHSTALDAGSFDDVHSLEQVRSIEYSIVHLAMFTLRNNPFASALMCISRNVGTAEQAIRFSAQGNILWCASTEKVRQIAMCDIAVFCTSLDLGNTCCRYQKRIEGQLQDASVIRTMLDTWTHAVGLPQVPIRNSASLREFVWNHSKRIFSSWVQYSPEIMEYTSTNVTRLSDHNRPWYELKTSTSRKRPQSAMARTQINRSSKEVPNLRTKRRFPILVHCHCIVCTPLNCMWGTKDIIWPDVSMRTCRASLLPNTSPKMSSVFESWKQICRIPDPKHHWGHAERCYQLGHLSWDIPWSNGDRFKNYLACRSENWRHTRQSNRQVWVFDTLYMLPESRTWCDEVPSTQNDDDESKAVGPWEHGGTWWDHCSRPMRSYRNQISNARHMKADCNQNHILWLTMSRTQSDQWCVTHSEQNATRWIMHDSPRGKRNQISDTWHNKSRIQ